MSTTDRSIASLRHVENMFLEALVSGVDITRTKAGFRMDVLLGDDLPCVWNHAGVRQVRDSIPDFSSRASRSQHAIEEFFGGGRTAALSIGQTDFPFRFASGGALPVVRASGKDYYCFFYRDIFPVGWNIANGGCRSRAELVNPLLAVERELREELLILDHGAKIRYVFAGEGRRPIDWVGVSEAPKAWSDRLGVDWGSYRERHVPIKWLDGPDTLAVTWSAADRSVVSGCFLTVTAGDFGIEIDRVAKIAMPDQCVILDGETAYGHPINQIVGLFEVDRLDSSLARGSRAFMPDRIFWNARECDAANFESVLDQGYFKQPRFSEVEDPRRDMSAAAHPFDLCPVTRAIIARHRLHLPAAPRLTGSDCDVFISFPYEDVGHARRVYDWCLDRGLQAFFSDQTLPNTNFSAAIDDAIDAARHMIVVSTDVRRLRKQWVEFEWRRFSCDILNGRKPQAELVPFISGFNPVELPGALRLRDAVVFDQENPGEGLQRLGRFIC